MNRLLRLWRRPVVYRTAIGLYITLVLALAGVIFAVNSLDVQTAMYLRADPEFETGRTHGARGAFHYAPTGQTLSPESMQWTLRPAGEADRDDEPPEDGDGTPVEFLYDDAAASWPFLTFRLPEDLEPGAYRLWVQAGHEEVADLETVHDIEVSKRSSPAGRLDELRWPRYQPRQEELVHPRIDRVEDDNAQPEPPGGDTDAALLEEGDDPREIAPESTGRVELAFAPAIGEIPVGLARPMVVRTFDADTGRPVPARLELQLTDGVVDRDLETPVETDELGFGTMRIRPVTDVTIEAEATPLGEDADGIEPARFEMTFDAVTTQSIITPTSRVVTPNDEIEAVVQSRLPGAVFQTDLYDFDGERFLDARATRITDGDAGVRFSPPDPEQTSRLLRIQSYQSVYGTEHAWDSDYVLFVEDDSPERLRELAVELFEWIVYHTDSLHHDYLLEQGYLDEASASRLRELIEAGLTEISPTFQLPEVLMNTRDADREALDAWREDIQRDLNLMLTIAVFVGIAVVLYFVIIGMRRHRKGSALMRELARDAGEDDEFQDETAERLEQFTVVLQGVIVLSTLITFAIGILIVVSYL